MPDGLNDYRAGGQTYLVTANEGDAREWGDYVEAVACRATSPTSGYGPVCADSPLASHLGDAELGRLNVTIENGFDAEAGLLLRAVRVRRTLVLDLDDRRRRRSSTRATQFERITHEANAAFFNSNHTENVRRGPQRRQGSRAREPLDRRGRRPHVRVHRLRAGGRHRRLRHHRPRGIPLRHVREQPRLRARTPRPSLGGRRPRSRGRHVHPGRRPRPRASRCSRSATRSRARRRVFAISALTD